jgi:hypothetical protein
MSGSIGATTGTTGCQSSVITTQHVNLAASTKVTLLDAPMGTIMLAIEEETPQRVREEETPQRVRREDSLAGPFCFSAAGR